MPEAVFVDGTKPLKLLFVTNSSRDKCKSFYKSGAGLTSINIRCHLVLASFGTVPRLNMAGDKTRDFFFPLYLNVVHECVGASCWVIVTGGKW